jgi:hypothetical protein
MIILPQLIQIKANRHKLSLPSATNYESMIIRVE